MKNTKNIIYKLVLVLMVFASLTSCSSDDNNPPATINIPDTNFEQALINLGYDTNGLNGNILKVDAEAVTNLNVISKDIHSLEGIEAFINLQILQCVGNELITLDVSSNIRLEYLTCFNNHLTNLDVSANTILSHLSCANNELQSLNVKNGNNNADSNYFNATGNPNLTCIEVDDVTFSTNNWTYIDTQTSFSKNCN